MRKVASTAGRKFLPSWEHESGSTAWDLRAGSLSLAALVLAGCGGSFPAGTPTELGREAGASDGANSGGPTIGDTDATPGDAGDPAPRDASGPAPDDASGLSPADGGAPEMGLHVVMGNGGSPGHIVDGSGSVVALHGADRSGTEYACIQGYGIFDGPSDQASIDAMKTWKINAVRVPLNEDCWLGINGVKSQYGGVNYQRAVADYVTLLRANGMVVILDLHWAAPGTEVAKGQLPMPDADHSPTFWSQVAAAYANDHSVIFDLFNEPYITDWACWLKGGPGCAQDSGNKPYDAAGMATLLKAVRAAGAHNVVILGGLGYSSNFSQWVASMNSIPSLPAPLDGLSLANVAASWHQYDFGSTGCPSQYNQYGKSQQCGSASMTAANASINAVLSAGFPVVIGECGISAFQTTTPFTAMQIQDLESWFNGLLTWAEQQGQGYLAWDWNISGAPFLLKAYDGTPSPGFGQTYQAHLKKF